MTVTPLTAALKPMVLTDMSTTILLASALAGINVLLLGALTLV